jgi:hypothetical protein
MPLPPGACLTLSRVGLRRTASYGMGSSRGQENATVPALPHVRRQPNKGRAWQLSQC